MEDFFKDSADALMFFGSQENQELEKYIASHAPVRVDGSKIQI